VNEGVADYISMSRPLIREPHLINRWKAGDFTKSACVSDNMCFQPAREGKGIYCVTEKREKTK
jgi:2,4-dienoyl-CoA reductase-like NADH-dependent reductase (Old Yellow Enzyme family)